MQVMQHRECGAYIHIINDCFFDNETNYITIHVKFHFICIWRYIHNILLISKFVKKKKMTYLKLNEFFMIIFFSHKIQFVCLFERGAEK